MSNSSEDQELRRKQQIAFGAEVVRIRKELNLSQKAVAERVIAFYSEQSAYRRIERGERRPERDPAIAILRHGLRLTDVALIDRLLLILDYNGLAADERTTLGLPADPAKTPSPELGPMPKPDFWNAIPRASHFRNTMLAVAAASILVSILVSVSATLHPLFTVATCMLYAALFAVSIRLESTFQPARPRLFAICVLTAAFVLLSATAAITLDHWLIGKGTGSAELWTLATFGIAAVIQWLMARQGLSDQSVVAASFQTHTAQSAHLKNTIYFLVIVLVFWVPPMHCIAVIRHAAKGEKSALVRQLTDRHFIASHGIFCLDPAGLAVVLVLLIIYALIAGPRLLENLKPHRRLNTYQTLLYLRAAIYFTLCIFCILWFSINLGDLTS